MNRIKKAEQRAYKLLDECVIEEVPVALETVVNVVNARLTYEPFKGNLSGLLYRDVDSTIIGVNERHSEQRQRFTIAHEIGHLLMHEGDTVHIDGNESFRVKFRDERSSLADDIEEIEANAFAAALLMPEHLLLNEFRQEFENGIDLAADMDGIERLAKKFNVSQQALLIRLSRLGLLNIDI